MKAEREGFQHRITELENQNARLEQRIKQMECEHQTQCSKFGEYIDKVKRYFPHVDKLLPLIDFCRNTLHFSEQIIQELCKLKKVKLRVIFIHPNLTVNSMQKVRLSRLKKIKAELDISEYA